MYQSKEDNTHNSKNVPPTSEIDLYIFDMDGTTYLLDGVNNTYSGSSLEKSVQDNLAIFVSKREEVTLEEAYVIINKVSKSGESYSKYFSSRYHTTRTDYFNEVWDIDPNNIINQYEVAVTTISELSSLGKRMILLTASPSIWVTKVCRYLNIKELFDEIFTGETFENKVDILNQLSEKYIPTRTISIGDQYETEIEPAEKLGMFTLYVKHPNELKSLLNYNQ